MFGRGLTAILVFGATSVAALAADLDLPPMETEQQAFNGARWDGLSIGVNGSALWAPDNSGSQFLWPAPWMQFDGPNNFTLPSSGAGLGVQLGYDKQYGSLVYGAIIDDSLMIGAKSTKSFAGTVTSEYIAWPTAAYDSTFSQSLTSFGTIRGKIGYAWGPDWLFFATGGLAFGTTQVSNTFNLPGGVMSGAKTALTIGEVAGVGVQYAMSPQFSVGLEGLAYNLGNADSVSTANFFTYEKIGGATVRLPMSEQLVNKTDFSGFQLRLSAIYTFDGGDVAVVSPTTDPNTEVPLTVGTRSGMSMGQAQMTLYDASGGTQVSRLTYKGATAWTEEPYVVMDLPGWDMYVSAFAGLGRQLNGTLQDEDFPPGISPYSSTNSSLQDGSLTYGVIDVGYNPLVADWYKVGVFAGYTFQSDNYNAFGCTQTATNPFVCPGSGSGIFANNLTISDSFTWNGARLGVSGSATPMPGLTVSGSAAWLPLISVNETNYHWLRMPGDFQNAIPGNGSGSFGFQLEAMVDYRVLPSFDIGAGLRYWSWSANGHINFQDATTSGGGPQVAKFSSDRMQAFLQTGYHF